MNSIRLILFDIDGTLLWPKGAGRESSRRALLEVFGTTGGIETHSFGGKTDWATLLELLGGAGYSEERLGALMPAYEQAVVRHLSAIIGDFPVEACPGALALVDRLRGQAGVMIGLVTGNVAAAAPVKLRAAGFDPAWFAVGAYGSESPDRARLAALALARAEARAGQAIAPEQVVIIGDTAADVACARAVGAVAVAVRTGYADPGELEAAQPDHLLDDLTTFWDVVGM